MQAITFRLHMATYLNVGFAYQILGANTIDPSAAIGRPVVDRTKTPWRVIGTITDAKLVKEGSDFVEIEFTADIEDDSIGMRHELFSKLSTESIEARPRDVEG